jgi:25S rRNA (adenine2142-N1)-methyltransferase
MCEKHGLRPKKGERKPRCLEVGALNTQILSCPWLDVKAIDLKTVDPRIEEQDFFTMAVPSTPIYDLLVLGMVINYVDEPFKRGEMLRRCHAHLRTGGYFVMVIPKRCVTGSKFMSPKRLLRILNEVGFDVLEQRASPKIKFYFCRKTVDGGGVVGAEGVVESPQQNHPRETTDDERLDRLVTLYPHPPKALHGERFRKNRKSKTNDFSISFRRR